MERFEYIIIAAILLFQIRVFWKVFSRIKELKTYFPILSKLSIRSKEISLSDGLNVEVDYVSVDGLSSDGFGEVVKSTNSYLTNNKGSAADFNIIKDITERHIDTILNSINSTISAPLYLGLTGTFFGIIYGLSFLDFNSAGDGISVIDTSSIQSLIDGVVTAMIASAAGLVLTLINSAWYYKEALYKNEKEKNIYYDFIQSQLLPKLSKDVSDSLGSLKSNLDHFNNKFGENLINYKDSFALLNENLEKEKEFLEAIKEVGLNRLSTQIVNTFSQINEASNEFHDFQLYQTELNKNISSSIAILKEYNKVSTTFEDFNNNLNMIAGNINESSDFYQQFKSFLETHFSEIDQRKDVFNKSMEQIDSALTNKLKDLSDKTIVQSEGYNEQWRSTTDLLNEEISKLFSKMVEYIQTEAESLKKYIAAEEHGLQDVFTANQEAFKDFGYIEQFFTKFSAHAVSSHTHYENIELGLKTLSELLSKDASLIKVNKNLVEIKLAIEQLNITLSHDK